MPEQTGFSPFLRLPAAPQDSLGNEDSSAKSPSPITEPQAEDRATVGHHPASENGAPPFIFTATEDYQTDYPEEGVEDLDGNADYSYDYLGEFVPSEPPTTPSRDASGISPNIPSDPESSVPPLTDTVCSQNDFECADGSACLPSDAVCDGLQHCGDGSDEADCQRVGESPGGFPS